MDLGKESHAGWQECPPCNINGDKRGRKRNVMYESFFRMCNKDTRRIEGKDKPRKDVNIGETRRSVNKKSKAGAW